MPANEARFAGVASAEGCQPSAGAGCWARRRLWTPSPRPTRLTLDRSARTFAADSVWKLASESTVSPVSRGSLTFAAGFTAYPRCVSGQFRNAIMNPLSAIPPHGREKPLRWERSECSQRLTCLLERLACRQGQFFGERQTVTGGWAREVGVHKTAPRVSSRS